MNRLAAIFALSVLVGCAPTLHTPGPLLTAETSSGEGLLFFKVTNVSGRPLLYWNSLCLLKIDVRLPDGSLPAPVPRDAAKPLMFCNLAFHLEPNTLAPGESLVERKGWPLRAGTYTVRVSAEMLVALDQRSDEQRRLYRTPAPDSGCRGIPCPPEYPYGTAPNDPFNPRNMPQQRVTVAAPPVTVTVP